jgi:hypothetical protein
MLNSILENQETYLTLKEFKEWLNMYPFVRDMVREALMPKIWSLQDHKGT